MRVFLATEFRCTIYKGEYYLATRAYVIFVRYAKAFGDIVLCSRFEEVDEKLKNIMKDIFANSYAAAEKYGLKGNLVAGANIAGFEKVADAMLSQGII